MRAHLKPDELRLYDLIWKRALASQMAPARFDQVGVDIERGPIHPARRGPEAHLRRLPGPLRRGQGRRGGRAPGDPARPAGRRGARPAGPVERAALHPAAAALHGGDADQGARGARHRAAVDLRARPSRRSAQRGYVNIKERRLFPEESAFRVTDLLVEHFPEIVDLEFTARMEDQLDEVAGGERRMGADGPRLLGAIQRQGHRGQAKIAKQVEMTDIAVPADAQATCWSSASGATAGSWAAAAIPSASTPSRSPARSRRSPALPGVGEVCPLCGAGPPGGASAAASGRSWAATATRSASTSRGDPRRQRAVRHLPEVRAGDGRHQARAARPAAVLGLRPLSRLRLRHLDPAGVHCSQRAARRSPPPTDRG